MSRLPDDRRSIFTDVYQYYEAHWDMPDTVEAWQEAAEQLGRISQKHGGNVLVNKLLAACYDAMDDERRVVRRMISG